MHQGGEYNLLLFTLNKITKGFLVLIFKVNIFKIIIIPFYKIKEVDTIKTPFVIFPILFWFCFIELEIIFCVIVIHYITYHVFKLSVLIFY